MRRLVSVYLHQNCLASAARNGNMPTTVRIEIAGMIRSVHDGGPSKKVSSGAGAFGGVLGPRPGGPDFAGRRDPAPAWA